MPDNIIRLGPAGPGRLDVDFFVAIPDPRRQQRLHGSARRVTARAGGQNRHSPGGLTPIASGEQRQ